jgi:sugar O-acyltransferase (sialic acid O-acetyltransferase NeuD family)
MKFIYSSGGFAREFHRCIRDQYGNGEMIYVDDAATGSAISYEDACRMDVARSGKWIIGFAAGDLRKKKMEQVSSDGFSFFSVISKTSIVGDNVTIGEGAVLSDFSMITADASIGKAFQCNIYSYVAHDCVVGDYVTLAPRVSVNGRVIVEDDVYIGTGATILPGKEGAPLTIGRGAIIGAHALVTKDVKPYTTVVGMPAKPREKKC